MYPPFGHDVIYVCIQTLYGEEKNYPCFQFVQSNRDYLLAFSWIDVYPQMGWLNEQRVSLTFGYSDLVESNPGRIKLMT